MKSRHSSRQKQTLVRLKAPDINYQSARECENNSKLANLLNLSDFNLNDLTNRPNASFISGINNKVAQSRKSAAMFTNSLSSYLINNEGKQIGKEKNQTMKPDGKSKTKRSKSSKKNILSCKQILNIVKKRDTFSTISFQPTKSNIFSHYGQNKTKKKQRKQKQCLQNKHHNVSKMKNEQNIQHQAPNFVEDTCDHQEPNSGKFVANYPLSMSHSLIVFSEKDSSLNNTKNILSKMSNKLSKSSEFQLQNKLETIKIQHAAIIIQKNWRGYLTRKLLSDYIVNEESRLVNRLINLKAEKEQYQKFQRMSPGCNKLWSSHEKQAQQFSSIFQNSQEEEYHKKAPVFDGHLDENQVFQSILQLQNSVNVTQRMKVSKELCPEKKSVYLQKSVNTQNSSRKMVKSSVAFTITSQFNQLIQPNQRKSIKNEIQQFSDKVKVWLQRKIQSDKQKLKIKVLNSSVQFDQMLSLRQKYRLIKINMGEQLKGLLTLIQTVQILQQRLEESKIDLKPLKTPESELECQPQESSHNCSPISEYFTIELPTEELTPYKQQTSSGLESLKTYLENLHEQCINEPENSSQTAYLCKVLKKHAEIGPENMVQRCLIQMLVQMLTGQYMIQDLLTAIQILNGENQIPPQLSDSPSIVFIRKWADQLEKWQLGPIQQVSGNMEQSADVTERKFTIVSPEKWHSHCD